MNNILNKSINECTKEDYKEFNEKFKKEHKCPLREYVKLKKKQNNIK